MSAARWAQRDLLGERPRADVRVYAVWFNMYPGDGRAKWPAALLTDARVTHYWDESRAIGEKYLGALPLMLGRQVASTRSPSADAMWDALYLYGPAAVWSDPAPPPVAWGYPIIVTREDLTRQIDALLGR